MENTLNIGCGYDQERTKFNIDKYGYGKNMILDIDKQKLPFKNNTLVHIIAEKVLEHLNNLEFVMQECHRVLKPGATMEILVPYYKHPAAFGNPLHKNGFGWQAFDEFAHKKNVLQTGTNFEILDRELIFKGIDLWGVIPRLAIANQGIYERWLSHFFPARYLKITLKKVKE